MVPLTDYPSTPTACALAALAVLIILVARYPDRGINTSPRKGIPGPRGLPLVGNLFQVLRRRDDIPSWLHEMEARYGPLFTYTMVGYGRAVVVNHVLWVEHVKKRASVLLRLLRSEVYLAITLIRRDDLVWKKQTRVGCPH